MFPMKPICLVLIPLIGLVLSSCSFRIEKGQDKSGEKFESQPQVDGNYAYIYSDIKDQITGPKCVTCHDSSSSFPLETFDQNHAALQRIYTRVFVDKDMPPEGSPSLTAGEKSALLQWIVDGGPESRTKVEDDKPRIIPEIPVIPDDPSVVSSGEPTNEPSNEPTDVPSGEPSQSSSSGVCVNLKKTVGYDQVKDTIFHGYCFDCHSTNGSPSIHAANGKYDLTEFSKVIRYKETFISRVLDKSDGNKKPMPPNRTGIPKLSDEHYNLFKTWVEQGLNEKSSEECLDVPSPTPSPTPSPSVEVSANPSASPIVSPSFSPTVSPSSSPEVSPSPSASATPVVSPSVGPSLSPSGIPSGKPSVSPSVEPSSVPSPSESPTYKYVYSDVRDRVLIPRCVSCHSTGDTDPALDDYVTIITNLDSIRYRAIELKDMPEDGPPLADDELDVLSTWINDGGPLDQSAAKPEPSPSVSTTVSASPSSTNNTDPGGQSSPSVLPTATPSCASAVYVPGYNDVKSKILETYCITCHKHQSGQTKDLTKYDLAKTYASEFEDYVIKQEPPNRQMPPKNEPQLLNSDRALFQAWIDGGLKEKGSNQCVTQPSPSPSDGASPSPKPSASESPTNKKIAFSTLYKKVLKPKCTICHGDGWSPTIYPPAGDVLLNSEKSFRKNAKASYREAVLKCSMPIRHVNDESKRDCESNGLKLKDGQKDLFVEWLTQEGLI